MILTIENFRAALSLIWFSFCGSNVAAVAMFIFPLFIGFSTHHLLILLAIAVVIGLAISIHFKFRSQCGRVSAVFFFVYLFVVLQFMFGGGTAALAMKIAGRPDLCWLAFYSNCTVIVLSLFAGMVLEGRRLELWAANDRWQQTLRTYIDDTKHLVSPALMTDPISFKKQHSIHSSMWIGAIGGVNIPLMFEIYGGGRNNAIFIAAPLLAAVFAYINLKHFGPVAIRLWLLRKLEKSAGRPFINADYEQIQELRRTFFLSRWLMKDYVAPVCATPDQAQVSESKTPKQLKRRRRS